MREKNKSLIKYALFFAILLTLMLAPVHIHPAYAMDTSVPMATSETELKQQLFNDLEDRQTNFIIHYVGNSSGIDLKVLFEDVSNQDDYLKYTIKDWQCSLSGTTSAADFVFSVNYWETKAQVDYVTQTVNGILSNIITPGMNDHQKEKVIHDYIVLHVAYDESFAEHSAYAALTLGKTVCQGYALLTYKMLSSAGIENKIVEGAAGGSNHSWNLVNLDGNWYHLDVTWDDPLPDKLGRVLYNYYNLTDTEIAKDHTWTQTYPVAQTSYFQALCQLMQNSSSNLYQDLIQDLSLQYLMPENTVNTYADLTSKIKQALDIHASTLNLRYLAGSHDPYQDIENILSVLAPAYPLYAGANGSITDYIPGNVSGDVIITLALTYRQIPYNPNTDYSNQYQYEITNLDVFPGYFKNVDYSDPNVFLQTGIQTEATSRILDLANQVDNNKDLGTIAQIFNQVAEIRSSSVNDKFALTADQILDRGLTGCTDYGLVFASIARAKGIPTVFVQTMRNDWIRDMLNHNPAADLARGHILVEVFVEGQWYLVDSTAGKIYFNYDKTNSSLPDGYYVFAKSIEVFDAGIKNEADNYNKVFSLFQNFDLNSYHDPRYTYLDLQDGKKKIAAWDLDTAKSNVIWIEGLNADPVVQIAHNPKDGGSAGLYIGLENIYDTLGNVLPNEELTGFSLQLDYDPAALQVLDVFDEQKLGLTAENSSSVPGKLVITYQGTMAHDAFDKLLFLPIALTGSSQFPTQLSMHFSTLQDQNSDSIFSTELVTEFRRGKILNENAVTSINLQDAIGGLQYLANMRSAGSQIGEVNLINMASIVSPKQGDKTLVPSIKNVIALLQQLAGLRDASFVYQ